MEKRLEIFMKFKDLLLSRRSANKLAVVDGDIQMTYADLYREACRCQRMIRSVTESRAHVALLFPNSASYVTAYCGVLLAECVVVPIYHKATRQEIAHTVDTCDVQILLTNSEYSTKLQGITFQNRVSVINIDRFSMSTFRIEKPVAQLYSPAEVSVMLGTSGSTNEPKRVMLSDDNLLENARSIIHSLQYTEDERILAVLPLTFASGNTSQLVVSLLLSATLYIYHGVLHPRPLFAAIKRYGITSTTIVPSVLKILLADTEDHATECETLRVICFGGGPTDSGTLKAVLQNPLRNRFVHMYGQTEASTRVSHLHFATEAHKLPSVGRPLLHVEVAVESDKTDGETGEICVRGPNVMVGYYREETSVIHDGWLHTGDVGYLDEDGYLYITGRKKNVIICSGMNIYAEEVEEVLCSHPNVAEALVYGVPDAQHDELPVAEVVPKPSVTLTQEELLTFCAERLSAYKVPVRITFVEALERTYNGKIARKRSAVRA